ncbi:MAG: uracil-DNA glycosylase [Proteobacteria bacterium]|nr:uracil-DNA glycosylase [Pseudomonadota bacterium]
MTGLATPAANCPLCSRLAGFRTENRAAHPDWHNAPVESFGPLSARLLVVGLAPGLRGANRTARPFTGDFAGDLLYPTLAAHGFSSGEFGARADDGLSMVDCRITNAVRCVPPENRPTTGEFKACLPFLAAEIAAMPRLAVILALGKGAHDQVLRSTGALPLSARRFGHAAEHDLPNGLRLADSYHCSRYNTNTGRLTPAMFDAVIATVRARLDGLA